MMNIMVYVTTEVVRLNLSTLYMILQAALMMEGNVMCYF